MVEKINLNKKGVFQINRLTCDTVLSARDEEHFALLGFDSVLSARSVSTFRRKH